MGMYIAIGRKIGWSTSFGVFDCIVEATRENFNGEDRNCMHDIYRPLDDQAQSLIALDDVGVSCFNLFYKHCKQAMEEFPETERGKYVPPSHIPGILWNWSEILRIMREDSRYLPE